MTSAYAFRQSCLPALVLAGIFGLLSPLHAQSTNDSEVAVTENGQESETTIDRGELRLKLLIRLVENELQEAELRKSRLTVEAAELDQQRRAMEAEPSTGSLAEKRRFDVIEERLQQIDKEMAEVNGRLPEISAELAELQARLDEANGVVRDPEPETASNDIATDASSQWLDSKRQIQEALVYLGGYNALIDGDFGPRTQEAVRVYQGRQNVATTGTLTDEQEQALLEEADLLRARYGMKKFEDQAEGYRISYPSGLLPEGGAVEADGRRFVSNDGQGELLITTYEESEGGESATAEFSAIYTELLSEYEVQYRRKRDDWFVVAGLVEEGRIIYDTARLSDNRMVRARLSYPAEWRDLWSPFAVIMFNTFEAIPIGNS
ncbi:MAG: peptidoglycan-binding protein [Pseudomonadota bacterium]